MTSFLPKSYIVWVDVQLSNFINGLITKVPLRGNGVDFRRDKSDVELPEGTLFFCYTLCGSTGPSRIRTCRLRFMCIDFYTVFKALYVCFDLHGSPLFNPNTIAWLLPSMRAEE